MSEVGYMAHRQKVLHTPVLKCTWQLKPEIIFFVKNTDLYFQSWEALVYGRSFSQQISWTN